MLSATPPKLQRIPRPGEKPLAPKLSIIPKHTDSHNDPIKLYRVSRFTTVPQYIKVSDSQHVASEPSKSMVGSVTTWFPPSTKIHLNSTDSPPKNPTDAMQSPRPQSITIIGDRKFLIVPKHSVLSVSPTIGAAVNTPAARPITSPTADRVPLTIAADKNIASVDLPTPAVPTSACLGPTIIPDLPDPSSAPNPIESSMSEKLDMSEANSNTASDSVKSDEKMEELTQPTQTSKE